jgi:DNA-binding HxlR family transcriptional regulator
MAREYGEFCPISLGAEVFAERWTPIILRNLELGAYRFGDILDGAPGLPRSVLVSRLRQLEADGVVSRLNSGLATEYHLTEAGRELASVAITLGMWAARWRERRPHENDPHLVLWVLSHMIDPADLPREEVVVGFEITDAVSPEPMWLVATRSGTDLLVGPADLAVDGSVRCDTETLIAWHSGLVSVGAAVRDGRMSVEGPRWLHRLLGSWGRLSPFAGVRPAAKSRALATAG